MAKFSHLETRTCLQDGGGIWSHPKRRPWRDNNSVGPVTNSALESPCPPAQLHYYWGSALGVPIPRSRGRMTHRWRWKGFKVVCHCVWRAHLNLFQGQESSIWGDVVTAMSPIGRDSSLVVCRICNRKKRNFFFLNKILKIKIKNAFTAQFRFFFP